MDTEEMVISQQTPCEVSLASVSHDIGILLFLQVSFIYNQSEEGIRQQHLMFGKGWTSNKSKSFFVWLSDLV